MGKRIVDEVSDEHARLRALEELRSEARERIGEWNAQGIETTWLSGRLDADDADGVRADLAAFERAVDELRAFKATVMGYRPEGRSEKVDQFNRTLGDPMELEAYRILFDDLKGQIFLELEYERTELESSRVEAEREAEALRVQRLEQERELMAQEEDRAREAAAAEVETRERMDELRSARSRWLSDVGTLLSGLEERLELSPPEISIDGRFMDKPDWTIQRLPGGKGLRASVGSMLSRRTMELEVDTVERERVAFPTEMMSLLEPPAETLVSAFKGPLLRLLVLEECPAEVREHVRKHSDRSFMPIVLETSTGEYHYNEERTLARLFTEYLKGERSLLVLDVLRSFAKDDGSFMVSEVAEDLQVPQESVVEIAEHLVKNDRAIRISPNFEYAILEDVN